MVHVSVMLLIKSAPSLTFSFISDSLVLLKCSRGIDTVLGETSDPREIFVVNVCEDVSFGLITKVATVQYCPTPDNWHMLGGEPLPVDDFPDDGTSFFFQKMYDAARGRFEDVKDVACPDTEEPSAFCASCEIQRLADAMKTPSALEPLEEESSPQDEVFLYFHLRIFFFPHQYYFLKIIKLSYLTLTDKMWCGSFQW